jgi:hypothetical protein
MSELDEFVLFNFLVSISVKVYIGSINGDCNVRFYSKSSCMSSIIFGDIRPAAGTGTVVIGKGVTT